MTELLEEFVQKHELGTTINKAGERRTVWAPEKKAVYELFKGKRSVSSFSIYKNQVYIPSGASTFLVLSGTIYVGSSQKIYQRCHSGNKIDLTKQLSENSIRILNPVYNTKATIIELSDRVELPDRVKKKKEKLSDYSEWAQDEKEVANIALATAQIFSRTLFSGFVEAHHYHPQKNETFWVISGKVHLIENHEIFGLREGNIKPGIKQEIHSPNTHSIKALENTILFECNEFSQDPQNPDKDTCYNTFK